MCERTCCSYQARGRLKYPHWERTFSDAYALVFGCVHVHFHLCLCKCLNLTSFHRIHQTQGIEKRTYLLCEVQGCVWVVEVEWRFLDWLASCLSYLKVYRELEIEGWRYDQGCHGNTVCMGCNALKCCRITQVQGQPAPFSLLDIPEGELIPQESVATNEVVMAAEREQMKEKRGGSKWESLMKYEGLCTAAWCLPSTTGPNSPVVHMPWGHWQKGGSLQREEAVRLKRAKIYLNNYPLSLEVFKILITPQLFIRGERLNFLLFLLSFSPLCTWHFVELHKILLEKCQSYYCITRTACSQLCSFSVILTCPSFKAPTHSSMHSSLPVCVWHPRCHLIFWAQLF